MRGLTLRFVTTMAAFVIGAGVAVCQTTSGDIVGTVKDATGAVVANATVTVTNEATGVTTTATTDRTGAYRAPNLLSGAYDLKIVGTGFAPYTLKGITVNVSTAVTENATLSIASSSSVEVEAFAGVALDTTTNNLSTTLSTEELNILPTAAVGFGVLNASLLAPNVASPGGAGIGTGPSVGGQRPRNNNYTIEGVDDNDKSVTGPLITVPNDAVSEFTLITSQFSPEFGHSSGGQFNTNILSGTNRLHGKIYEYFQNRNLNAQDGPAGGKSVNQRFDFNRYGGQVGGPVKKDKLFFFANFEKSGLGQSGNSFLCVPTAAGRATLNSLSGTYGFRAVNLQQYLAYLPAATVGGGGQVTTDDQACQNTPDVEPAGSVLKNGGQVLVVNNTAGTASTKIPLGNANLTPPSFANSDQTTASADYSLSPQDNLRFRYSYFTQGSIDTTNGISVFFTTLPLKEHLMAFSYFHNFTPNLINEARIGYNRLFQSFPVGGPGFPGLSAFPNLTIFDAGIDLGPDDNAPQSGIQNLYQLTDNISYTRGSHSIKIGFDGRKYISPQNFVQRQRGDYEWDALDEYLHDLAPTSFGERSAGAQNYAGDQTALYGYVNDTWRATSKLTLNYGLRYEFTSVPSGERRQSMNAISSVPGLIDFHSPQPAYTNFAPRVGIAYAPDDKTSIRAGFGIAYDVLFDNLGLLTSPPQLSQTNDVGILPNPDYGSPNFLANGGLSPNLVPITSATVARAKTAAYLPDQVIPYSENYNLTIQRVFLKNYTAQVQYLGTRGVHLATQNQVNIQPKVTAANQLPTYFSGASFNSATSPTYATVATGTTVNTLAALNALSNFVPAYSAAGFTSKITSYAPFGGSNYNGLGFNLTRRFVNGFQMNGSYTFSKALDDSTAEVNASALTERRPQDSRNQHAEYARSALDRTQRLTIEAVYDLPYFKHSQSFLLRNLAGGWQISPLYTYETPEYVTATSNKNSNLNGDSGAVSRTLINPGGDKSQGSGVVSVYSSNPTLVAKCGPGTGRCTANQVGYAVINPAAYYVVAGPGTLATSSRNTISGRPIDNLSLAAGKRISFTDRYSLEFQAQAFNLFNHAQYVPGNIDGIGSTSSTTANTVLLNYLTPGTANFNQPQTAYNGHSRTMQLAAKFNF